MGTLAGAGSFDLSNTQDPGQGRLSSETQGLFSCLSSLPKNIETHRKSHMPRALASQSHP